VVSPRSPSTTLFIPAFCGWFVQNISTAAKTLRNGQTRASRQCSYGQAAKVLDVAAKVYVYCCAQPSTEAAQRLVAMLHAALDTDMMHNLCRKSPPSLYEVDRPEYQRLQALVIDAIAKFGIYPVEYDDLMWRRLQRPYPILSTKTVVPRQTCSLRITMFMKNAGCRVKH
jgi:hypothetical protein